MRWSGHSLAHSVNSDIPTEAEHYLVQVKEEDIPAGYVIHYGVISEAGKLNLLCFETREKVDTSFRILAVVVNESIQSVEFSIMKLHAKLRGDDL
jgi:hypothetical protein